VVWAKDKDRFFSCWRHLCLEFADQPDILTYIEAQYLSVYPQWAKHVVREYLNFGQTTTSQSESSNHCAKTYLLSGVCDWYELIKALRQMVVNNKHTYEQRTADEQVRVRQRYIAHHFLGDLRYKITRRALDIINDERIRCISEIKEKPAEFVCDERCTTWRQFRLPCAHSIYERVAGGEVRPFTVDDVDKRWLSDHRDDPPHLHIQDPRRAIPRGRPRNQEMKPSELPIELQMLRKPASALELEAERREAEERQRREEEKRQKAIERERRKEEKRRREEEKRRQLERRNAGNSQPSSSTPTSTASTASQLVPSTASQPVNSQPRRSQPRPGHNGRAGRRAPSRPLATSTARRASRHEELPSSTPQVLRTTRSGRITKPSSRLRDL